MPWRNKFNRGGTRLACCARALAYLHTRERSQVPVCAIRTTHSFCENNCTTRWHSHGACPWWKLCFPVDGCPASHLASRQRKLRLVTDHTVEVWYIILDTLCSDGRIAPENAPWVGLRGFMHDAPWAGLHPWWQWTSASQQG